MTGCIRLAVNGRYATSERTDVACLVELTSVDDITLHPLPHVVLPSLGTTVICYLNEVGVVEGEVGPGRPGSFTLRVVMGSVRRSRLEARLAWLLRSRDRADQRAAARIVPIHRDTTLRMPDGRVVAATIVDLSRTGVALATSERPEVGTVVTVGKRFATVVRDTPDGIAATFRMPFGALTFNESVLL